MEKSHLNQVTSFIEDFTVMPIHKIAILQDIKLPKNKNN